MLPQSNPSAMPDDLYITEELLRRAPKKVDYRREKEALQDLASQMADRPSEILPHFVDLAMEMTGGTSGGLSIYEENPSPGVFRWQYLRGELAPFVGVTTPRDFSPCGITLDRNAPVLSKHPERVYDWISNANIIVPEVLLVPLYLGGTEPLGTLWIVSPGAGHFDSGHARAMTELATFVGIALRMVQGEQKLQRALEQQETLAREMNHRIKNMFAITDGMIRVSARAATTPAEMSELLSGRLHALAAAHNLVRRSVDDEAQPTRVQLGQLLEMILKPHEGAKNGRLQIAGPPVQIGDRATNGIALVFHELATNAAKYGSLSHDDGTIELSWEKKNNQLVLTWQERGGPSISAAPTKKGFGTTLSNNTVVGQFGGTLEYDLQKAGLKVEIKIPVECLST